MEVVKEIFSYIMTHGPAIASILLAIIAVAEMIVRLTPTKKDDGAVQRIGGVIRKLIDYAKVVFPNNKKGGGQHIDQADKEKAKDV